MASRIKKEFPFDREKFKALMHYIIWKAGEGGITEEKLAWVMWKSECWHYVKTGKPITGSKYIKGDYPIPVEDAPLPNQPA